MLSLHDYALLIKDKACCICKKNLNVEVEKMQYYDHSNGYRVECFSGKQWLWYRCPHCNYQNSLEALKVKKQERRK